MRRPQWASLVLAFWLAGAGATTTARAEREDETGLIAFAARRWEGVYRTHDVPGGVEATPVQGTIYTVKTDGSGLRQVFASDRDANAPSFSPDGRWLYFQANGEGGMQIQRCRPDGSELATIVSPASVGPPWKSVYGLSVASTGRLTMTVYDGQSGSAAITDADGSNLRIVAPKAGYLYMAALGPDGQTVVCSGPALGYRLLRIGPMDQQPFVLTPDHPESFGPQFTPDGRTIVFFRRDGDVYRVDVDGRNLQRLTTDARHVEFRLSPEDKHGSSDGPHVSPDGRRIAYISERDGTAQVHVMNLDGSAPRKLTDRKSPCARVRWSPDGSQIAFVSFEGPYPQLFTIPAEGGEPRQLTSLNEAVYFLAWQPKAKTQAGSPRD